MGQHRRRAGAVAHPSPVFSAAWRSIWAPRFSSGSLRLNSLAIVTPSLQTIGAPQPFWMRTDFDFGPSVMRTASASSVAPRRIFSRAAMRVPAVIYAERGADPRDGRQGARAGSPTSPRCPASSRPPTPCRTRTGATAFRSAASRPSTPTAGGVVSAGGVGFDISCGVRCLHTGPAPRRHRAVQAAARRRPVRDGTSPPASAAPADPPRRPRDGRDARRRRALGGRAGLRRGGRPRAHRGARLHGRRRPARSRSRPSKRQRDEMGTLGSGNHYLEVQEVAEIFDAKAAAPSAWRRARSWSDPLRLARPRPPDRHRVPEARWRSPPAQHGIALPDRELACAPIRPTRPALPRRHARGDQLRARQPPDPHHLVREVFARLLPRRACRCSTTCRTTPARSRSTRSTAKRAPLYVHRKGATRAFGPGHPRPAPSAARGRPAGADRRQHGHRLLRAGRHAGSGALAFSSACHGAGRA
jgi:tRNA-splicing ligase RtcB (3'-phosphate/5'-hydroxy nucleic acid ligase)